MKKHSHKPDVAGAFAKVMMRDPAFRRLWQSNAQHRQEILDLCWADGTCRDRYGSREALAAFLDATLEGRTSAAADYERELFEIKQSSLRG